jgi:poly(A) polymerase
MMALVPVRKIDPPGWLRGPELAALFAALQGTETTPHLLCVGGCVRNTLLGLPPGDIDLATVHRPEKVMEKLEAARIHTVPTGLDHGTVTAIINKKPFEITTLRKDVETDGRRAVVGFTTDWTIDAMRRDFTMNTLLMDLSGNIYDPLRIGIDDLAARYVRFVGNPAERLREDILRLLRFFRFYAQYGRGDPDPAALAACRAAAGELASLSRERIMQEFFKILLLHDPAPTLALMRDHGIMTDLIAPDLTILQAVIAAQSALGQAMVEPRLAALLDGGGGMMLAEHYFALSRVQKKRLEVLLSGREKPLPETLYRFGAEEGGQYHLYRAARAGRNLTGDEIARIQNWTPKTLPVSGADLKALGLTEGERMGRILKNFEEWWIARDFPANRAVCLDKLRDMANGVE